jgi:hypothetical protein
MNETCRYIDVDRRRTKSYAYLSLNLDYWFNLFLCPIEMTSYFNVHSIKCITYVRLAFDMYQMFVFEMHDLLYLFTQLTYRLVSTLRKKKKKKNETFVQTISHFVKNDAEKNNWLER